MVANNKATVDHSNDVKSSNVGQVINIIVLFVPRVQRAEYWEGPRRPNNRHQVR